MSRESKKDRSWSYKEDTIVEIAESQIGYFGGSEKILLPSPATVEGLIRKIPEHRLLTTDLLREERFYDKKRASGT
jgi:hypothetical protein